MKKNFLLFFKEHFQSNLELSQWNEKCFLKIVKIIKISVLLFKDVWILRLECIYEETNNSIIHVQKKIPKG